ncbi:MFS transporter [Actinoalloteichus fjordicus]|uniref:MFS transporter n=1 Tax=Actinoalloteichus fjordicus TaxID=1612552 RepID=UPI002989A864|nr:MFS transporter [Actinoalloteichus fjordicus]
MTDAVTPEAPDTPAGRDPVAGPDPAGGRSLGRSYWQLWTSSGLSNLADGVLKVVLPLIAVRYTQSPALIAGLAIALTLPWLLFALPAGALVDRLDRRRAMLVANLVRAGLLGVLSICVGLDIASIWLLYVVAFGVGITETIYDTSAQSILPSVVARDQLSRANGRLYAAELTTNQFIGPPLGGLLMAAGAVIAVVTPAAAWLVAVGALLLVRGSFRPVRERRSTMRADIAEGLRFLWGNRILRTLASMTGVFNLATSATGAVFVLYAVGPGSPMGLSEPIFGLLLTSTAVGSLLGSFIAERVERRLGRARSLALSVIGGTVLVGIPAVTTHPVLIGAGFALGGATTVIWNVIVVSLRQRITPDRLLGRMNSAYRLLAWGTMPVGAVLGGVLAEVFGLRTVFAVMALVLFTLLVGMRILTDRAIDAAEQAGAPT